MISILVLTKNEEKDLPGCLESVRWSDDVHVYDSGSSDDTTAIATGAGARVTSRTPVTTGELFGGDESEHKNWALANIAFRHDWVLHLDADERVTPELAVNLVRCAQEPADKVAFRVRRRDFWGKTWLKHAVSSSYYIRLFRPDKMHYERFINPVSMPQGPVGEVDGFLDHHPFSKGMEHWLARHNSYSTLEARQILENRTVHREFRLRDAFLARDPNERRFHQKELFYRMPARPLVKFLLLYIGKRGFLDGRAGFDYALLQSFYEHMIVMKCREYADPDVRSRAATRTRNLSSVPVEALHINHGAND
jgi:glycosyltransferase involved in cell wall biosynthesis